MFGLPLTFAAPLALAALAALPALWFLLRVTPPRPRRIAFPPLKLVADLLPGVGHLTPQATYPPWLDASELRIPAPAAFFRQRARVALTGRALSHTRSAARGRLLLPPPPPTLDQAGAVPAGPLHGA